MHRKDARKYGRWIIASLSVMLLSGCPGSTPGTLLSDVVRKPPEVKPATVTYLVRNDRPLLEWVLEVARTCDEHGCA